MSRKIPTAIKGAKVQIKRRIRALALERDKLRELADDYIDLAGIADEALEALHSAVEALSRHV